MKSWILADWCPGRSSMYTTVLKLYTCKSLFFIEKNKKVFIPLKYFVQSEVRRRRVLCVFKRDSYLFFLNR